MHTIETSKNTSFKLLDGESILDGLKRTNHEVEYQCGEGYCGMCKLATISGTVSYAEEPIAWVAANEILPCCCIPSSDLKIAV